MPRDAVLAGIARIQGNPLNPSDSKAFQQLLHKGYSGYVHGAYVHTMELFSAPPNAEGKPDVNAGKFYMRGGMPPARTGEMVEALEARAELLAVAVSMVAKRIGNAAAVDFPKACDRCGGQEKPEQSPTAAAPRKQSRLESRSFEAALTIGTTVFRAT